MYLVFSNYKGNYKVLEVKVIALLNQERGYFTDIDGHFLYAWVKSFEVKKNKKTHLEPVYL